MGEPEARRIQLPVAGSSTKLLINLVSHAQSRGADRMTEALQAAVDIARDFTGAVECPVKDRPPALPWFREQGYLPEALVNFLALMGWSMPDGREVFSYADVVENFDFGRVSTTSPVFDLEKLDWLMAGEDCNGILVEHRGRGKRRNC